MPRPPLAQPLFFFFVLLILGGAAGAVGSFWWTARWHERQAESPPPAAVETAGSRRDAGGTIGTAAPELPLVSDSEWNNRTGWQWLVEPMEWRHFRTLAVTAGAISFATGEHGVSVYLAIAEVEPDEQPRTRFDAVAFDAAGERLEAVEMRGSGTWAGVALRHFTFTGSIAPADSIARIGIEALTREGWRTVSEQARKRAAADGIRTLPFPEVGSPYPFDLLLPDGSAVRSSDYRGRVVLFDCWATWCAPCMDRMPEMRQAFERFHRRGLDIVGVNFDLEWTRAETAIREHAPDWPHVFAGGGWETIDLWGDATTVRGIPRFFLVDRQGVLRWDSMSMDAADLTRAIEECLEG